MGDDETQKGELAERDDLGVEEAVAPLVVLGAESIGATQETA